MTNTADTTKRISPRANRARARVLDTLTPDVRAHSVTEHIGIQMSRIRDEMGSDEAGWHATLHASGWEIRAWAELADGVTAYIAGASHPDLYVATARLLGELLMVDRRRP